MMTITRIGIPQKLLTQQSAQQLARYLAAVLAIVCLANSGCTSLLSPVSGVPAHRLPRQFFATPKNDLIPVDISRLRQEAPRSYIADADDILGVYIEGVLGSSDEPPPVQFPEPGSDLPPALGYPIPVREDGTISLPLVPPIPVRGLTLTQIENVIRRAYTIDSRILPEGKDRMVVTLMKKRTYTVIVMRSDGSQQTSIAGGNRNGNAVAGPTQIARGFTVDLDAYKNDVLHALAETGGLPGVDAKNELLILRSNLMDMQKRDQFVQEFYSRELPDPCLCRPPLPDDPAVLRIPLRLPPGQLPNFSPDDIILEDGDIVMIEGREREVFYTGGLLGGGEYPLPRDYDLDVLGALAISGQGVAGNGGGNGNNRGGGGGGLGGGLGIASIGGVPPGQLFILRKTPCDGQVTIAVDLARAVNDPAARPLVQAGDILVLQFKPSEEILNFGLGTFFTFGFAELFNGNRN